MAAAASTTAGATFAILSASISCGPLGGCLHRVRPRLLSAAAPLEASNAPINEDN
jgi:hypothetical protein